MARNSTVKSLKWLKIAAFFEGISLISLLFIALPFKYFLGIPQVVSVVGAAHGALFTIFILALLVHLFSGRISWVVAFVGMVASFIPFGTFIYKEKYLSNTV